MLAIQLLEAESDRGPEETRLLNRREPHLHSVHPVAIAALGDEPSLEKGRPKPLGEPVAETSGDDQSRRAMG